MPLRAEYTLHQSDLNEFLSAPLWEEKNGTPLSVLSALARLDIDPWAEAARLAALPRDAAASALAIILRRLPAQQSGTPDAGTVADRLVTLLPEGGSAMSFDGNARQPPGMGTTSLWVVLALVAILFVWTIKRLWS
ncbi:hypothetical protein [Azospirillum sp. TSO22-1]|uniref:hypothetical protein n=1 Tax=Azospirillum sp. TSO22-1 TaxID=716789 RepID=UPI000D61E80A|nr:hypothetical protein [Azospirillum sp. TSO22-1]PWC41116.1 hypothetical protein TSO221_24345 [Azospirillum sp. TSO22-1]